MAVGLLGSMVPTAGDDAAAAGLLALSHRFNGALSCCVARSAGASGAWCAP